MGRLCILSVLSAEFYLGVGILGEEDDKGEVHPRQGTGAFPPSEKLSVYPSTSIHRCCTGRQELTLCHYAKISWEEA